MLIALTGGIDLEELIKSNICDKIFVNEAYWPKLIHMLIRRGEPEPDKFVWHGDADVQQTDFTGSGTAGNKRETWRDRTKTQRDGWKTENR